MEQSKEMLEGELGSREQELVKKEEEVTRANKTIRALEQEVR